MFLNLNSPAHPAALVVFDRVVAANPAFRKAWLLHGLEEPTLSPGRIVARDTRAGYSGKLTTDTLLPTVENTVVEKIGGPSDRVSVDGKTYLALLRPEGMNEGGRWRVEVSPRTPATTDYFLHVLQVGDHTPDSAPLPVHKLETATHVGALIADRVVVLAKSRDRTSKPVSFSFAAAPAPAKFQILIADLTAGKWRVECDDRVNRHLHRGRRRWHDLFHRPRRRLPRDPSLLSPLKPQVGRVVPTSRARYFREGPRWTRPFGDLPHRSQTSRRRSRFLHCGRRRRRNRDWFRRDRATRQFHGVGVAARCFIGAEIGQGDFHIGAAHGISERRIHPEQG